MKAIRLTPIGSALGEAGIEAPLGGPHDLLIRVKAAGICHSDAHYRAGVSSVKMLPLTLGHEVAGVVEEAGDAVQEFREERSRLPPLSRHLRPSWPFAKSATNNSVTSAEMIGKHRDGGYAEFIAVPERQRLSFAWRFHLRKARS